MRKFKVIIKWILRGETEEIEKASAVEAEIIRDYVTKNYSAYEVDVSVVEEKVSDENKNR